MGAARLPFFISSTQYKKIVSKGIKPQEEKKSPGTRRGEESKPAPALVVPGTRQPCFIGQTCKTVL